MEWIQISPACRTKKVLRYEQIDWLINFLKKRIIWQDELIDGRLRKSLITWAMYRVSDSPIHLSVCIGPSWVWKSFLGECLSEYMKIPLECVNLASLNEFELNSLLGWISAWWAGNDKPSPVESIYNKFSETMNDDSPMGIIVFDEFDKIKDYHSSDNGWIRQLFVSLLDIFENSSNIRTKNWVTMNLSNIWFIFCWNIFLDENKSLTENNKGKIGFKTNDNEEIVEQKSIFFEGLSSYEDKEKSIKEKFRKILSNSVYSRIERNIIVFNELDSTHLEKIIELQFNKMIKELNKSVHFLNVKLPKWEAYKDEILKTVDVSLGMRNVKNIINSDILHKIILEYLINPKIPDKESQKLTELDYKVLDQEYFYTECEDIDLIIAADSQK